MIKRLTGLKLLKIIAWLLVLLAIFIVNVNNISDADFWWHLKTGEYIWQNHEVPKADFFSHTAEGRDWTTHEWLSQVVIYLPYKLAGFNGLVYATAFLATLTYLFIGLSLGKKKVPFPCKVSLRRM